MARGQGRRVENSEQAAAVEMVVMGVTFTMTETLDSGEAVKAVGAVIPVVFVETCGHHVMAEGVQGGQELQHTLVTVEGAVEGAMEVTAEMAAEAAISEPRQP